MKLLTLLALQWLAIIAVDCAFFLHSVNVPKIFLTNFVVSILFGVWYWIGRSNPSIPAKEKEHE